MFASNYIMHYDSYCPDIDFFFIVLVVENLRGHILISSAYFLIKRGIVFENTVTEVNNFYRVKISRILDQNIGWFQIPMYDSFIMYVIGTL